MSWPINNRSTTLEIDYFYLKRRVSKYLFGNYNSDTLNDEQNEEADEVINLGVMQYYYPPPLAYEFGGRDPHAHEWSFMRPHFQFETVADQRRYTLPLDWERPLGQLCYVNTTTDFYPAIDFTAATRLLALEHRDSFTTYPVLAAVEPSSDGGVEPQSQVLVLHPTPDAAYLLSVQYQALATRLTSDRPYPLGGQLHGQGILASVMSAAELHKNNANGPMHQAFMEKLTTAVLRDHERGPQVLGYNGNGAAGFGGRGSVRRANGLYYSTVTYGNTTYAGQ